MVISSDEVVPSSDRTLFLLGAEPSLACCDTGEELTPVTRRACLLFLVFDPLMYSKAVLGFFQPAISCRSMPVAPLSAAFVALERLKNVIGYLSVII